MLTAALTAVHVSQLPLSTHLPRAALTSLPHLAGAVQIPIADVSGIDELGFLPGWGNTAGRVRESFQLLLDIIQVSTASVLMGGGGGAVEKSGWVPPSGQRPAPACPAAAAAPADMAGPAVPYRAWCFSFNRISSVDASPRLAPPGLS